MKTSQFVVHKIERFTKSVVNDDEEVSYIPSETCKIYFEGQEIPQYIYIWKVRFQCEPYIRKLRQCLNCLRFGHISTNCKGTETCRKCGVFNHLSNNCESNILKCANCKGEHMAGDKICPERIRQLDINLTMGSRNLSYYEANLIHPKTYFNNQLYSVRTSNNFSILSNLEKNFPELSENNADIPIYVPDININSKMQKFRIKLPKSKQTHSERKYTEKRPLIEENSVNDTIILENSKRPKNNDNRKELKKKISAIRQEKHHDNSSNIINEFSKNSLVKPARITERRNESDTFDSIIDITDIDMQKDNL